MSMRVFLLLFFLTLTGCQSDQTEEKPTQSQTASTEQTDQQPQPPVRETSERDESVESNNQDDPAPQAASEEPAVEEAAVASETQNVGEEPITAEGNSPAGTAGSDWATFLGPGGNSKSAEKGALTKWPEGGLRIVWQKPLGTSYGIGSVSKGRYYQFDRTKETVHLDCLDAKTGNRIWQFRYHSDYEDIFGYDGGPRSSPLVDENRIYLLGVEGLLQCLETETGKLIWKVDTAKEFGVVQNFFGAGSTPVIEGDLVIAMVGGSPEESQTLAPGDLGQVTGNGTGVVAFDKRTGKVRYRISDELASYATPVLATIDKRRWCFAFARGGLIGFDPVLGKIDFHYPWRARSLESVNASTPIVIGNEVFISETYGPGSSLLKVQPGKAEVVWSDDPRKREKAMLAHWNTPIYHDGYLYGCSGRHTENADLRCIEWKTGKVMWSVPRTTRLSLMYVDQHFISLGEFGDLLMFKANPEKFEPTTHHIYRATATKGIPAGVTPPQLLKYPCWAAPILSHGLLYVRGSDRLLCLELVPPKS